MLAARTTLAHFSVSSAISLPKSAGEPGNTVAPRSANRAFSLGSPFDEPDRSRCQSGTLVSVRPRELGLMKWSDVAYWSDNWKTMERLDDVAGHEAYIGGWYDLLTHSVHNVSTPYYVRHDEAGRLLRLVRCYGSQGPCEHYTLIGHYALYYRTNKTELPQWQEIDQRLVQLVDSWRPQTDT